MPRETETSRLSLDDRIGDWAGSGKALAPGLNGSILRYDFVNMTARSLVGRAVVFCAIRAFFFVFVLVVGTAPISAQAFGNWWWTAEARLAQRNIDSRVNDRESTGFGQRELQLSGDINGYIIHPTLARFDAGLTTLLSKVSGTDSTDSSILGLRSSVEGFPRGAFPFRLFVTHQKFDYIFDRSENGGQGLGFPEDETQWGGNFDIRTGLFKGTQLSFAQRRLAYNGSRAERQEEGRQLFYWSRTKVNNQNQIRLERVTNDFAFVDTNTEDYNLEFNQLLRLAPESTLTTWIRGSTRNSAFDSVPGIKSESYTVQTQAIQQTNGPDTFDVWFTANVSRVDALPWNVGNQIAAAYRWRPTPSWEVAPSLRYIARRFGDITAKTPRAGVRVVWNDSTPNWRYVANGAFSYGEVRTEGATSNGTDANLAYSFHGTLGHGSGIGFREELTLGLSRAEAKIDAGLIPEAPDLGLTGTVLGTTDSEQGRLTLGYTWDGIAFDGWAEYFTSETGGELFVNPTSRQRTAGALTFKSRRLTVQATIADNAVRTPLVGLQTFLAKGANIFWRPIRNLSLAVIYQEDHQDLVLAPNLDGSRWEATATYDLGRLHVELQTIRQSQQTFGASQVADRTVRLSVYSRFAGWLPVVTGNKRRGVIR